MDGIVRVLCCGLMAAAISACQSGNKAEQLPLQDSTSTYPRQVQVWIQGDSPQPDSAEVRLMTEAVEGQMLLRSTVMGGKFELKGILSEDGFYYLNVGGRTYPIYVENHKNYTLRQHTLVSDSKATQQWYAYQADLARRYQPLDAALHSLNGQLQDPKRYNATIDALAQLKADKVALQEQMLLEYLSMDSISDGLKLQMMRTTRLSANNYAPFKKQLASVAEEYQEGALYQLVKKKIDNAQVLYEEERVFPEISPRNSAGDSLSIAAWDDQEALLIVFWASFNSGSIKDVQTVQALSPALRKLKVQPIYLSWEKDFDLWEENSAKLGISSHSYLLNKAHTAIFTRDFEVFQLPHFMVVDARSRTILSSSFIQPYQDGFLDELKKIVWKKD